MCLCVCVCACALCTCLCMQVLLTSGFGRNPDCNAEPWMYRTVEFFSGENQGDVYHATPENEQKIWAWLKVTDCLRWQRAPWCAAFSEGKPQILANSPKGLLEIQAFGGEIHRKPQKTADSITWVSLAGNSRSRKGSQHHWRKRTFSQKTAVNRRALGYVTLGPTPLVGQDPSQ